MMRTSYSPTLARAFCSRAYLRNVRERVSNSPPPGHTHSFDGGSSSSHPTALGRFPSTGWVPPMNSSDRVSSMSPLHLATLLGNVAVVRLLLAKGANQQVRCDVLRRCWRGVRLLLLSLRAPLPLPSCSLQGTSTCRFTFPTSFERNTRGTAFTKMRSSASPSHGGLAGVR